MVSVLPRSMTSRTRGIDHFNEEVTFLCRIPLREGFGFVIIINAGVILPLPNEMNDW